MRLTEQLTLGPGFNSVGIQRLSYLIFSYHCFSFTHSFSTCQKDHCPLFKNPTRFKPQSYIQLKNISPPLPAAPARLEVCGIWRGLRTESPISLLLFQASEVLMLMWVLVVYTRGRVRIVGMWDQDKELLRIFSLNSPVWLGNRAKGWLSTPYRQMPTLSGPCGSAHESVMVLEEPWAQIKFNHLAQFAMGNINKERDKRPRAKPRN